MAWLAKGTWQDLRELSLNGNNTSESGLEMAGQWPDLSTLTLDGNSATAATCTLLNISFDAIRFSVKRCRYLAITRPFSIITED